MSEYIYIFVRQDISWAEQIVHTNHATYHLSQMTHTLLGDIPSMVVIGVKNEEIVQVRPSCVSREADQSLIDFDTTSTCAAA